MPYSSPDPYDDSFDEDPFDDDLDGDLFARGAAGGDGMAPPEGAADDRRALAAALAQGDTGVPMGALLRLALPLVALYGLDSADVRSVAERPEAAAPDAVALLEVTRLLWAFLSLPDHAQAAAIGPLLEHLGGAEPDADGWEVVHELIETTQPAWDALGGAAGAATLAPHALPFDALLAHPAFSDHAASLPGAEGGYGPSRLGEVEARALFAQPLLDDPDVLADADAFEAALARADEYWDIAAQPAREAALAAFVRQHARSAGERARLTAEATAMLERFDRLFPEHRAAA